MLTTKWWSAKVLSWNYCGFWLSFHGRINIKTHMLTSRITLRNAIHMLTYKTILHNINYMSTRHHIGNYEIFDDKWNHIAHYGIYRHIKPYCTIWPINENYVCFMISHVNTGNHMAQDEHITPYVTIFTWCKFTYRHIVLCWERMYNSVSYVNTWFQNAHYSFICWLYW